MRQKAISEVSSRLMSHCPELVHKLLSKIATGKGKQDHHDWLVLVLELLSDFTFAFNFHTLEKEMATHSSVLAWKLPGTEEPGGLPSMGLHRVGYDCSDLAAAAAAVLELNQSEFISLQGLLTELASLEMHGCIETGVVVTQLLGGVQLFETPWTAAC